MWPYSSTTTALWLLFVVPLLAQERTEGEKRAIAAIEKLGGEIEVDEKQLNKPVIHVYLSLKEISDADLVHLKEFKDLRNVSLAWVNVTDAGVIHLKEIRSVQTLFLSGNHRHRPDAP